LTQADIVQLGVTVLVKSSEALAAMSSRARTLLNVKASPICPADVVGLAPVGTALLALIVESTAVTPVPSFRCQTPSKLASHTFAASCWLATDALP